MPDEKKKSLEQEPPDPERHWRSPLWSQLLVDSGCSEMFIRGIWSSVSWEPKSESLPKLPSR